MAVGQQVLAPVLDTGALDRALSTLEVDRLDECAAHGRALRHVLHLHAVLAAAGLGDTTVAQVALQRQVSEQAAARLLVTAELLVDLPGGLEAVDCGLLTPDTTPVVQRLLQPLSSAVRAQVWHRLRDRLLSADAQGVVLAPARLTELLTRWTAQADPDGTVERRRSAEADGDVSYRRRDDGVGDLFLTGAPAPLLQAVLQRIRARSAPFGSEDDRTAGKRRLDAALDLLLGRDSLPLEREPRHCAPGCGCRLGTPVPCGVDVAVLIPLATALGRSDDPAELVGHGPLDRERAQDLLAGAPRLRPVWVDGDGVPVALGSQVVTPERGAAAAREALLRLASLPPPEQRHPRHPDDHGPHEPPPPVPPPPPRRARPRPGLLTRPHPAGTAGPYAIRGALRTLLRLRAPRCEWPACGTSAQRCDGEHDRAWPYGPTCACNTGPLCRRHHRVKQLLTAKTRHADGVRWSDPTGRTWLSPLQSLPPAPAVRPLAALAAPEPHSLSDGELAELLAEPDLDPVQYALRAEDGEPDGDPFTADDDHGWGLALDDPYRWAA